MRFMEWNIHGMGGYGRYVIPVNVIANTIMDIKPDVLVLLEFVECANGFCDLQNTLNKLHYKIFLTEIKKCSNGILIAVKDTFEAEKVMEESEFLEIKLKYTDNKWLYVAGMRILTQGDYQSFENRKKLFDARLKILKEQERDFILLFDANNGSIQYECDKKFIYKEGERQHYSYQYIWRTVEDEYSWSLITPDQGGVYNGGKYSVVTGENTKKEENYHTKEDHIISSFKKDKFQKQDYYWDFVSKRNGYGKRSKSDVLSDLIGLPDHAVLIAELNI